MTATYDPAVAERLAREAREDDARMPHAPWKRFGPWPQVTIYVDDGKPLGDGEDDDEPPKHVCDVYISDQLKVPPPDRCVAEADAIARTRNNLRAMADQLEAANAIRLAECRAVLEQERELEAARAEIERLRPIAEAVAGASPDQPIGSVKVYTVGEHVTAQWLLPAAAEAMRKR